MEYWFFNFITLLCRHSLKGRTDKYYVEHLFLSKSCTITLSPIIAVSQNDDWSMNLKNFSFTSRWDWCHFYDFCVYRLRNLFMNYSRCIVLALLKHSVTFKMIIDDFSEIDNKQIFQFYKVSQFHSQLRIKAACSVLLWFTD